MTIESHPQLSAASLSLDPFHRGTAKNRGERLLDAEFVHRLEALELLSRKIFVGRMKGERRSKKKGQSVEFADYKNYVVGDDLRFLDWNLYARLDRLYLRLFMEEEDLHVSVLVDASLSMDFGRPNKLFYARQLAAALAYIGLCNYDRVSLYTFSDRLTGQRTGLRGRSQMARVMEFLQDADSLGPTRFAEAAKQYALTQSRSGICVIISDFMDKTGYEAGFRYLTSPGLDVYALQVLSPQEIDPEIAGDLKLTDAEDDATADVTVSKPLLDRYKANLSALCHGLKTHCTRRGIGYQLAGTNLPVDQLILSHLRKRGLLR